MSLFTNWFWKERELFGKQFDSKNNECSTSICYNSHIAKVHNWNAVGFDCFFGSAAFGIRWYSSKLHFFLVFSDKKGIYLNKQLFWAKQQDLNNCQSFLKFSTLLTRKVYQWNNIQFLTFWNWEEFGSNILEHLPDYQDLKVNSRGRWDPLVVH